MRHPLSQRTFRKWLQGKNPALVIGRANDPWNCPCHTCIKEIDPTLARTATVRVGVGETVVAGMPFTNPAWLRRFIRRVDNLTPMGGSPITVKLARKIFRDATHPAKVTA